MTDQAMDAAHDHRLQAATESTLAKAVSRFLTPLLLGFLAWFGNQAFDDIRRSQTDQAAATAKQGEQLQEVRSDMKLLNAKVDYSVLQQLSALDTRIKLLEDQNKVLRTSK